jgi:hypothetical protein
VGGYVYSGLCFSSTGRVLIEASIVPLEHLDLFWDRLSGYLHEAAEQSHGRYRVEDIYDTLKAGRGELWVAFEDTAIIGAAVTHKVAYPQKTMLCIAFLGGREPVEPWGTALLKLIRHYARELKYDGIEAHGRMGWAKKLKEYGYEKVFEAFDLPV